MRDGRDVAFDPGILVPTDNYARCVRVGKEDARRRVGVREQVMLNCEIEIW